MRTDESRVPHGRWRRFAQAALIGASIGALTGGVVFLLLPNAASQVVQGLVFGGVIGVAGGPAVFLSSTVLGHSLPERTAMRVTFTAVTALGAGTVFWAASSNPQIDQGGRSAVATVLVTVTAASTWSFARRRSR